MPTITKKDLQRHSETGMTNVILNYNVDPEPPMDPLIADEMADWVEDGLRNGSIVDVTQRKPLRLPELPFELKGTVRRS